MGIGVGKTGIVRKHILVSGRIQGVDFRYRAYYLAKSLGLTGWVCNPYDKRVEMELQGHEEDMNQLFRKLQENIFIHIEHYEVERIPVIEERGFHVRGWKKSLENHCRALKAFSLPRV